jgi:hypothetical protein
VSDDEMTRILLSLRLLSHVSGALMLGYFSKNTHTLTATTIEAETKEKERNTLFVFSFELVAAVVPNEGACEVPSHLHNTKG